jgi:hypothetical protein
MITKKDLGGILKPFTIGVSAVTLAVGIFASAVTGTMNPFEWRENYRTMTEESREAYFDSISVDLAREDSSPDSNYIARNIF